MAAEYEKIEPNFVIKDGDKFVPDTFTDDRALIIKTDSGLMVILGCAHRGMINTLRHAQK
jgi:7,8-dihydropterin-6-yl-methyl-4-(beta-D-ribofuranosyl)aminobenzene 5'-phosphate synthase